MLIKHIFFDMDDTLTNTNSYLKEAIGNIIENESVENQKLFAEFLLTGKTTLQLPPSLSELSFKYGLKAGQFMLNCARSDLFWNIQWFVSWIEKMKTQCRVKFHICTHRGWHKDGLKNTEQWLTSQSVRHCFDDIVVLCSKQHPNKLAYLEQHYGDFIIVDDNPKHDINLVHDYDPRLVVYEGYASYPGYVNQNKVKSLNDVERYVKSRHLQLSLVNQG